MTEPIVILNESGNIIYSKKSNGYEEWNEYDANNNLIYWRNSIGVEAWREYDSDGKLIHWRNSIGNEWWHGGKPKTPNDTANERMLFFLSQLKSEFGIDMRESSRKGVALFFMAKQEEKKGRRLAFIDDDNNVVVELNSL